jgi:putative FmdB family regulatory protein
MPLYAYKCGSCGHAKDVLQKISDDPLTVCPSCGASAFAKQITAAGFQLKGSGWYATDFRGGSAPAPAADKAADKPAEGGKADAPAAPKTDTPSASAGGCGASCACH